MRGALAAAVHHVRELMDEVFGEQAFVSQIIFQTTPYATSGVLPDVYDVLLWYAKDKKQLKYRQLFNEKEDLKGIDVYRYVDSPDGTEFRPMTNEEMKNPTPFQRDGGGFSQYP